MRKGITFHIFEVRELLPPSHCPVFTSRVATLNILPKLDACTHGLSTQL